MPGKPACLSNVEIFISSDGTTHYEAQTSGSVPFEIQGFIQAASQVRESTLKNWLRRAEWTRIKTKLEKDTKYNAFMSDDTSKRVQVHGQPKTKSGGRPRKVNAVHYSKCEDNAVEIFETSAFCLETIMYAAVWNSLCDAFSCGTA